MIGKFQIQLGAEQLTSGMSSSDYATDGALGIGCNGLNPYVTPGVMYALATSTNLSSNLADNPIASSEDSQSVGSYTRTFIGDAGNYYTYNGSAVTKTNTATTNAAFYKQGFTDMVSFAGNTYVTTSNGNIDLWNTSSLTLTNSWWTSAPQSQTAMSANPHPMIQYQGNLYVADANKLNTITSTAVITIGVLILNTNELIYALGIDPVTGLLMVSVQVTQNISNTLATQNFVYLYDGISTKATRKIPVDDLITGFHNVEGIVYCGQGQVLGQWNGNGVTFLRKMANVTLSQNDLLWKHHMTHVNRILHVIDGKQILSYGTIIYGKPKGFFYTASTSTVNKATVIMPLGSNKIGVGSSTNSLYSWDFSSSSAGTGQIYFNNIYMPRPIYLRRVRVITTGITTVGILGNFSITSEKQVVYQPTTSYFTVPASASPQYVFDFNLSSSKMDAFQLFIQLDTQNVGLVRATVYYDIAE